MKQLLATMDSYEYARWLAFEKTNGPIGGQQSTQEALSSMHEQLQLISYLISQANFASESSPKGPVDPPQRYPRPHDPPSDASPEEVDFSEEWLPATDSSCAPDCKCNGGTRKPTTHF